MFDHYGWRKVVVFGKPLKIGGCQVYHHPSRDRYAIEREHLNLTGLSDTEEAILDAFLRHEIEAGWADDNAELAAKEAGRDGQDSR